MTDKTQTLPVRAVELPEPVALNKCGTVGYGHTDETLQAYAQQCVEAGTAPLVAERSNLLERLAASQKEGLEIRAQVAELEKDAGRYQWWTKTENDIPSRVFYEGKPSVDAFIDAAIDSARKATP